MTRKDYIAIADALAQTRPVEDLSPDQWDQWDNDRATIAVVLSADNPRFDRERFYTATEKE